MRLLTTVGLVLVLAATSAGAPAESPAPTGPSLSVGFLRFDPHDADFSTWLERFRVESYGSVDARPPSA